MSDAANGPRRSPRSTRRCRRLRAAALECAARGRATATTRRRACRVAKAYKMYVGGAFVRSESGRYFQAQRRGRRRRRRSARS